MAFDFPTDRANLNPPLAAGALQDGDTTIISDILYTFVVDGANSWWTANVATSPDDRYVNVGGDTMTGDLTVNANISSNGTIVFSALPAADPGVAGQLWNNGGVLNISAG